MSLRPALILPALVALAPLGAATPEAVAPALSYLPVPVDLVAKLDALAAKEGLDPHLLRAMAWVESRFNPKARSPFGALGLLQVMPATARAEGVTRLEDEDQVLAGAARHLHRLLDAQKGNVALALAAYNGGERALAEGRLTRETAEYIGAVVGLWTAKAIQPEQPLANGELQGVVWRQGQRLSVILRGRTQGSLELDLIPSAPGGEPAQVRIGPGKDADQWIEFRPRVLLLDGVQASRSLRLRAAGAGLRPGELSVPLTGQWSTFTLRLDPKS